MNKLKSILLIIGSCLQIGQATGQTTGRTAITPLSEEAAHVVPQMVSEVKQPSFSLSGDWQFRYSPIGKWATVQVPGELAMQGYAIEHDRPYAYRKSFSLPADYAGKHVILRFDGVYSQARLSVNGTFVREHHGGFTRWETDITSYIRPGKKNEIALEVTDRLDEISYASGYAHHPIGGILRDVTIFALPSTCMYDFWAETHLDASYTDATLQLAYTIKNAADAEIEYSLTDPKGKVVQLAESKFPLKEEQNINQLSIKQPAKWDAEHPNLYLLTVTMRKGGKEISRFSRPIGFRDVRVEADRLLVNGQIVKLRGACRHDIHPTLGRTTTAELDSLDALLFKRSNMNFVRTSHYPPSEAFLAYCDRFGIYVESETAVCFVDTYRQKNYAPGKTEDSAAFTPRYLSQCREMVKSFRSHPSILFWSIGNESLYGSNFQKSYDYVKATDRTRPVIFSYPGSGGEKNKIFDILSMHYQDVNGNVSQFGRSTRGYQGEGIPALFDEWAHPACYTYATLQDDPNIREFWGLSLEKMWSGLFAAPGGLGGAIWGYIDETFMIPTLKAGTPFWKEFARTAKPVDYQGECVGYGEWGIVDVWRREKPEFWSTKKAYSPIRLLTTQVTTFSPGERLIIPLHNRFDHTYLNEVKVRYLYKGIEKELTTMPIAPHQKGALVIPADQWEAGSQIFMQFFSAHNNELIDAELITLGSEIVPSLPAATRQGTLQVDDTADRLVIRGADFEIPFCKATGLITHATSKGKVCIEKGPFLQMDINLNHLTGAEVRTTATKYLTMDADWKKKHLTYTRNGEKIEVSLSGTYGDVSADIRITISPEGKLDISYLTAGHPNGYLRETGLSFYLPEQIDHLSWQRRGQWSYYPEGAFAGNSGSVSLYNDRPVAYGTTPNQPWGMDTHNYYYWANAGANCARPLTQEAKGMKENIYSYTLADSKEAAGSLLSIVSPDASLACRISKRADSQLMLYINNRWDYPEIAWGNFCKTLEATPCYGNIEIIF